MKPNALPWLWLSLVVIVLDLGTKYLALGVLEPYRPVAVIEGVFAVNGIARELLLPVLQRESLIEDEAAADLVTLARELRSSGRSLARVNGVTVNQDVLREVGAVLVDIHGQSEHLSLLDSRNHLDLLDRFADLLEVRGALHSLVSRLHGVRQQIRALLEDEAALQRRADMLRREVEEIDAAGDALAAEIALLVATDDVRVEAPTVIDEIEHSLYFLGGSIRAIAPRIHRDVVRALRRHYGSDADVPVFLRWRSWIGGDRDGNPNVTAAVTRHALDRQREVALFLGYALQSHGLKTITSSQSAFITALYVPLVPLLQWLVLRRPPRLTSWVGIGLAFAGLVLLSGPEAGRLTLSAGEIATLLGALAIAAEIILIGRFALEVDSRRITAVQLTAGGAMSLMAMPLAGEAAPAFHWVWLVCAVGLGVASALIQLTMNWAQKVVSPTRATLIYAGEPVWGGIFGRIAGDRLPPLALLGGVLIVAGVIAGEWRPRRWRGQGG